eukprot:6490761-Amphidinium_carterae.3
MICLAFSHSCASEAQLVVLTRPPFSHDVKSAEGGTRSLSKNARAIHSSEHEGTKASCVRTLSLAQLASVYAKSMNFFTGVYKISILHTVSSNLFKALFASLMSFPVNVFTLPGSNVVSACA